MENWVQEKSKLNDSSEEMDNVIGLSKVEIKIMKLYVFI